MEYIFNVIFVDWALRGMPFIKVCTSLKFVKQRNYTSNKIKSFRHKISLDKPYVIRYNTTKFNTTAIRFRTIHFTTKRIAVNGTCVLNTSYMSKLTFITQSKTK